MIYTVTFNPAIDYCLYTDTLNFGKTNRSRLEKIFFGGKGINVSRVLSNLGVESTALGFTAGFTGLELEKALTDFGIKTDFIRLKNGMTRINVKLKGEIETEINASGPEITADDIELLFKKLDALTSGDILVLAGSIPPTLPDNIYEMILNRLNGKNITTVVDTTKNSLLSTLKYKPFLIKPNLDELSELCEKALANDKEIANAALLLQQKGAQNVLVSLGADGALLLDKNGKIHRKSAAKITPVNTVGAGDSMVAGFLAGLQNGFEYAFNLSLAAGSATAATDDLATKEQIEALL